MPCWILPHGEGHGCSVLISLVEDLHLCMEQLIRMEKSLELDLVCFRSTVTVLDPHASVGYFGTYGFPYVTWTTGYLV